MNCLKESLSKRESDRCEICRSGFKTGSRKTCWICKKRILVTIDSKDEEFINCRHGSQFHAKCLQDDEFDCLICKSPLKTQPTDCIKCNKPFTSTDPDATELKEFACRHGTQIHKRCVQSQFIWSSKLTECPKCQRSFRSTKEVPTCIVCMDPITWYSPGSLARKKCGHMLNIHAKCDSSTKQCSICRASAG